MNFKFPALLGLVVATLFSGCNDDSDIASKSDQVGYLNLSLGLELDIQNIGGRALAVNTDNWNVIIYDAQDEEVYNFSDFTEAPEQIVLAVGDYTVSVSSEDQTVDFDTPFYLGSSDVFSITEDAVVPVTVNAALANVKVSVTYSDAVKNDFTAWETTVSSSSGNINFIQGETRSGYFLAGEKLAIAASLTFTNRDLNDEVRTVTGTIIETLAKDHYLITMDYTLEESAFPLDYGTVPLSLLIDETTNDIAVNIAPLSSISLGGSDTDIAHYIQQTTDGGYIVVGESDSNDDDVTNSGCWIVKLDASLNIVWQKTQGDINTNQNHSVQQTADGGYITNSYSSSSAQSLINKLDASGNLIWQTSLGSSSSYSNYIHSFQQCSDGGYVVAGQSGGNLWVVKLDELGTQIWEIFVGGALSDIAYSIQQCTDGGYIVAGTSLSNSVSPDENGDYHFQDCFIVKLDASGAGIWQKYLGGTGNDYANSIQQTSDGGYIIAGESSSDDFDVSENHGSSDYWIVKLDALGNLTWEKSLGGSGIDVASSIQQTTDGGYVVAGSTRSTNYNKSGSQYDSDYWVNKLDASGNLTWEKSFGGSSSDAAYSIQQTADGGYILAGYSNSTDGDVIENHGRADYWIVKIDAEGNL